MYVLLVIEMLATGERRGRESDVSQTQVAVIAELLVISQWDLMQPNQEFEGDMADESETHFKRLYFLCLMLSWKS